MKISSRVTLFLWFALGLAVVLVAAPVWAQVQSNDNNSGGSNSLHIGSGDTLGIGFGSQSFDVDINQCMGSTSRAFLFGIYGAQGLKANHWCQAESLYRMEKYQAAALTWCYKTGLGELYGDVAVCMAEMSQPPAQSPEPLPNVFDERHLEEEERHDEQQEVLIAALQEEHASDEKEIKALKVVVTKALKERDEREDKDAARRAATRAILAEKEDTK